MDAVIKIIGIGLIALIIIIIMKQYRPEFAIYISLTSGVLIFSLAMGKFTAIINLLQSISSKAGINSTFLDIIITMSLPIISNLLDTILKILPK